MDSKKRENVGSIKPGVAEGGIGGAKTVPESSLSGVKAHSTINRQIASQFDIPSLPGNSNDFLTFCTLYPSPHGILSLVSEHGANVNHNNHLGGGTVLHLAAFIGSVEVVEVLLQLGANVNATDEEGDTPLEVALRFKKDEVVKLLMKHGAKPQVVPILTDIADIFSECEIDPSELYFGNKLNTSKEMSVQAEWLKLPVTVKKFGEDATAKVDKLRVFRDEVSVLQQIRHPNIVLFFGVVARSHPMMIVTEYFPKGDLRDYLRHNKSLKPLLAVQFALDISRGMNYLHEHKSEAIIHRNLEPANILMDDSENLKVANFSASKLLKESENLKERRPYSTLGINCRYMAP